MLLSERGNGMLRSAQNGKNSICSLKLSAKSIAKCFLVIVVGFAIGSISFGLDANFHFVPQRFLLRVDYLSKRVFGSALPGIDIYTLKPVRVEVERGINLLLDPADLVPWSIMVSGNWQPELWSSISNRLSEGSVMLDIGAHIGYFTLKAGAKVGKSGKVIAFEPNPRTLKVLHGNIAASDATNVIVQPIACTDNDRIIALYDSTAEGNSGASSLSVNTASESYTDSLPTYSVRGRPIDDVVRELGLTRIDLIKVDVEGAETMVIRGAQETLKRFNPIVITEVNDSALRDMGSNVEELTALMAKLGYTQHKVIKSRDIYASDWEWIAP